MTEEFKEINPVLLELLAGLGIYGAAAGAAGMVTSGGSLLSGRDSCGPVFCSLSDPEYVSDH